MIALLLRLYPARWRARYGDEFEAVLEDRPLGPFDIADILLAALDAHLHLRGLGAASDHGHGFPMSVRVGGYASVLGGVLWLLLLAGNTINNRGEGGGLILGMVAAGAMLVTLVALVGLSAFQSRRHPALVWAAFAIPAAGAVTGLIGWWAAVLLGDSDADLVLGFSPFAIALIGIMALLVGTGLFAATTWLTSTLSRPAAGTLLLGAVLVLPSMAWSRPTRSRR